jgi:lia operon protein LiaG
MPITKLKKTVLILTAIAVVSLGTAAVIFFSQKLYRHEFTGELARIYKVETFDTKGIEHIAVQTASADVIIVPASGKYITVKLTGRAASDNADFLPRLVTGEIGNSLEVRTEYPRKVSLAMVPNAIDLKIEIRIPEDKTLALSVKVASGDITIENGRFSDLTLETASGDVDLVDVEAGSLRVDSSSGDTAAHRLNAERSYFSAMSGDIQIDEITGYLDAKTASGDISIHYAVFANDVTLQSASGDAELFLPGNAEFTLSANTSAGDITCEFPIVITGPNTRKRSLESIVGKGTYRVEIKTASGDISILPR